MFYVHAGLDPGHIVLDGDPDPPPLKRHSPQFSANVRCGQTTGWTKMPLGMDVDLAPGDFMLHGDPPPLPQKGGGAPVPNFPPMSIVAIRLDGSRCHLVRGRLQPRRLCSMGTQLPSPKMGQSPSIFGPFLLWVNGWMHQDATWHGGRSWSRRHCAG